MRFIHICDNYLNYNLAFLIICYFYIIHQVIQFSFLHSLYNLYVPSYHFTIYRHLLCKTSEKGGMFSEMFICCLGRCDKHQGLFYESCESLWRECICLWCISRKTLSGWKCMVSDKVRSFRIWVRIFKMINHV